MRKLVMFREGKVSIILEIWLENQFGEETIRGAVQQSFVSTKYNFIIVSGSVIYNFVSWTKYRKVTKGS